MENQKWLQWRKIGSSDAPVIMWVSPWTTPYQLWEKKLSSLQDEENAAMRRGKALEPEALAWVEGELGLKFDSQVCAEHPQHRFMTATVDGLNRSKKVMVELKCPGRKAHSCALEGEVPDYYYPQLQHQMEVLGYDWMYYASFDGIDGIILEVGKNKPYVEDLVEKEEEFWNCVLNWEAPPFTDKDFKSMEGNEAWENLAREWREVSGALKKYKAREEGLREALISLAGGPRCIGGGIKMAKSTVKGNVEYSKVPELRGVDLDPFRKASYEKWTVTEMKAM